MEKWLNSEKKSGIPYEPLQQGIEKLKARMLKGAGLQFFILLRHFVLRLFTSEILKFENQRRQNLVIMLTFLAVGGGAVAVVTLLPYLNAIPGFTSETVWIEKTFFITLSMAFVGIVSVLSWENMLMDEKDYLYLSGLPVKPVTLFSAKFASLVVFVGLLSVALHFFTMFIFTFFLSDMFNVNPFYSPSIFKIGWVHLLASFMANLFVFLAVAMVQGVLLLVLRAHRFKRVSMVLQSVLMVGFVSVFVWYPQLAANIQGWKEQYSNFVYYFPPIWFAGFYEQMVGNYDVVFKVHYYVAPIVVVGLMNLYLLTIPLGFRRFTFHASPDLIKNRVTLWAILRRNFSRRFLRHPVEKAIFYFSLNTMGRSRKHKLQLAVMVALPLTFVVTHIVVKFLSGRPAYFMVPRPFLVAVPFIFYLFLIIGFRAIVIHPIAEHANWVFRLTEKKDPYFYMRGLKKVFLMICILPVSAAVFLFFVYCWGPVPAFLHTVFSAVTAWWVMELVFITYDKMPFASAYVPGKANIRGYWFWYAAAIGAYLYGSISLGLLLLTHPYLYVPYYSGVAGVFHLLRKYHLRRKKNFAFVFDEEPVPEMLGLGLDMS